MKYCKKCEKELQTEAYICPVCGAILLDMPNEESSEYEAAEIISTIMTTGIFSFCRF